MGDKNISIREVNGPKFKEGRMVPKILKDNMVTYLVMNNQLILSRVIIASLGVLY